MMKMLLCLYLIVCLFLTSSSSNTSKCYNQPEICMNVSMLIKSQGYGVEEHSVLTSDGFILGLQRMLPRRDKKLTSNQRPVALLMHGLLGAATNWVTNFPSQSLGFMLTDSNVDVWLGNCRGNVYSRRHVNLKPDDQKFWQWSWDQMARFDFPAIVNYILNVTRQESLYYVAHSQGSLIAFAALSQDKSRFNLPQNKNLSSKIKKLYALGPIATVGHITSPIRYFSYFCKELQDAFSLLGVREFLPSSSVMRFLAGDVCQSDLGQDICDNVIFVIAGKDATHFNKSRTPVYVSHSPAGTSVQNIAHFMQMVLSKKFQMFNYGSKKLNYLHYRQDSPPLYNLTEINPMVKIHLFYGTNDLLADPTDVLYLVSQLKNPPEVSRIQGASHLDFIWGLNAAPLVYKGIINDIIKHSTL